jgi:type I restriction enzyme, S subunit
MKYPSLPISSFCTTGSGGTPSRANTGGYYDGSIPWVKSGELREDVILDTEEKITDLAIKESSAKLVPKGALLIAMYGATIGRIAELGVEGTTNQAICHIVPDEKVADKRYLYYGLRFRVPELIALGEGGAQPNINQQIVRDTQIPLPPLPEQKRIAAILDKADSIRRKRQETVRLTEELLRSVFLEMFGDPVTNPKGCEVTKFENVGSLDRGVSKHRPRNAPQLLGGPYPLIQTGEVANSDGYIRSYKSTYSEVGLKQSKMWPASTLCITIAANIAKTGILTFDACFPDSVVGFTPNSQATTEYVQYWLSFLQKILEDTAPESAQKNINLEILRNLDIPLPPISLQVQFSQHVVSLHKLKAKQSAGVDDVDNLFDSLLQRAFKGEL